MVDIAKNLLANLSSMSFYSLEPSPQRRCESAPLDAVNLASSGVSVRIGLLPGLAVVIESNQLCRLQKDLYPQPGYWPVATSASVAADVSLSKLIPNRSFGNVLAPEVSLKLAVKHITVSAGYVGRPTSVIADLVQLRWWIYAH